VTFIQCTHAPTHAPTEETSTRLHASTDAGKILLRDLHPMNTCSCTCCYRADFNKIAYFHRHLKKHVTQTSSIEHMLLHMLLQGLVTHGIEGMLPKTGAAHDFAQGLGDFVLGLSRLPHQIQKLSQNITSSTIQVFISPL